MFKYMSQKSFKIGETVKNDKNILLFQLLVQPWAHTSRTYFRMYFTSSKEESSAFLISDQNCHHRSNNYIVRLRYVGPSIQDRVLLAPAGVLARKCMSPVS